MSKQSKCCTHQYPSGASAWKPAGIKTIRGVKCQVFKCALCGQKLYKAIGDIL